MTPAANRCFSVNHPAFTTKISRMDNPSSPSKGRLYVIGGGILILVLGAAFLLFSGSGNAPPKPPVDSTETQSITQQQQCSSLLASVWEMVQPEHLGVSSDRKSVVSLLNEWLGSCGSETIPLTLTDEQRQLIERLLGAEDLQRIQNENFSQRDGDHIAVSVLYKKISDAVTADSRDDTSRMMKLFYYSCRSIAPLAPKEEYLPLYESTRILIGRGMPENRALLFAQLLHQLRIDAVIIRPQSGADDASANTWLVGVLLGENVHLFDTRLGLPIPSPSDDGKSILPNAAATLKEAAADDALLRRLDLDAEHPYALKSADLQKVRVELIGNVSQWSNVMARFQQTASGDRSIVVYDGLQDSTFGKGLYSRVAEFPGKAWTSEDVSVWKFPEEQADGFEKLTPAQQNALTRLMTRFDAPLKATSFDERTRKVEFAPSRHIQFKARMAQITGDYDAAIQQYVAVRIDSDLPPGLDIPKETRLMHDEALEDATYWGALSQIDAGKYKVASERFRDYLRLYDRPTSPRTWATSARAWLAISLADQGRVGDAILQMTALSGDTGNNDGYRLLLKRWRDAQANAGTPPAEAPAETGATDPK